MVLDAIDQRLWMLHPYAHCKGFCLNQYILAVEQLKYVSRRMTRGKNDRITDVFIVSLRDDTLHAIALDEKVDNPFIEMNFATCIQNTLP